MKRSPIKRTAFVRRVREKPRRSSYFEDRPYLAFLRGRRCDIARKLCLPPGSCSPIIDPDHRRQDLVGMGQRAADPLAYTACRDCHMAQHGMNGVLAGWERDAIDALIDECIAEAQAQWYGRSLDEADMQAVRLVAEGGGSTRGMFGAGDVDLPW